MIFSNGDKCELDDGSDTPFLPGLPVDRKPNRRTVMSTVTAIILSLAGSMVLLCCGFALGRSTVSPNRASYYQPADYENTLAAEGQDFIHHPVRFNGSFFHRSVYGGKPNPQLDEAWSRFTHAGTKPMPGNLPMFAVSKSTAERSTSYDLETAVQWKDGSEPSYLASLEFFHQFHCLDKIRKFIYAEYYLENDREWADDPNLVTHADHCVDMLREAIMCKSDTSFVMYHWLDKFKMPTPDFSTLHSCRDPEDLLRWTKQHMLIDYEAMRKQNGTLALPFVF